MALAAGVSQAHPIPASSGADIVAVMLDLPGLAYAQRTFRIMARTWHTWWRWCVLSIGLAGGMALASGRASTAGEIRLDYAEIAHLLELMIGGDRVLVRCAQAGSGGRGCARDGELAIEVAGWRGLAEGGAGGVWRVKAPRFSAFGGNYQVVPAAPIVVSVSARAQADGVRLEARAAGEVRFHVQCRSGACTDDALIPSLMWHAPGLVFAIAVRDIEGTAAMGLGQVELSGHFDFACSERWGVGRVICAAGAAAFGKRLGARVRTQIAANFAGLDLRRLTAQVPQQRGFRLRDVRGSAGGVRLLFCVGHDCD